MEVREATAADWESIWPFFRAIVVAGETYVYDPAMEEAQARAMWMAGPPAVTIVATDDNRVIGTASAYPNRGGPGAHVASASFMVDPSHAGRGTGRALAEWVIDWAQRQGFRAMQFNAVVETNEPAVALWLSLGFEIVGTVPEAFRLPDGRYVGLHVMHRTLEPPAG